MKHFWSTILSLSALLFPFFSLAPGAQAQACSDYVQTGKLEGMLALTNDGGSIYDYAYMSDETWNEENPSETTSINFEVSYDTSTGFSGRAWSELFGWIDFDRGNYDQGVFETVYSNQGAYGWGGWTGEINGLSNISYSTQGGDFSGRAESFNDLGFYVGLVLDFDQSNVRFVTNNDPECTEYVNLFINNSNHLFSASCPIATPKIKWTSQNIQTGTCVTGDVNGDNDGDLWGSTGSKADQNSSGENAAGPITESGTYSSPQRIQITCTGLSGKKVTAVASARCGSTPCDPSDPACFPTSSDGKLSPEFKEA